MGEARIDAIERDKRTDHQAGADEQDERHRDLRDHQEPAGPLAITTVADRPTAACQGRGQPRIRVAHDREQPETDARQQRHPAGEDQRHPVDPDFLDARKIGTAQRQHHAETAVGQRQAGDTPGHTEQDTLDQQLAGDAAQLAPSAARTASSWRRPSARTRSRLATLAQTMSMTSPRAPITIHNMRPLSPTTTSFKGRTIGIIGRRANCARV